MKSAIFKDPGLAGHSRQPRKQPHKKWPRASSPFVVPASSAPPSWNFDDMLSNYTSSGVLPPLLSPTLPPRFTMERKEPLDSSKDPGSDDDVDTDSLPLSLLSPTLPSIFRDPPRKEDARKLVQPLPGNPSTVNSMLNGSASPQRKNKVRWVDRLDDPGKPRFLLRIRFGVAASAYKKLRQSKSSLEEHQDVSLDEVHGLAISGLKRARAQALRPPGLCTYKEFLSRQTKFAREDTLLAIAAQFDWILCSAIAYDADRTNSSAASTAGVDTWAALHTDIPSFVHRIEHFIKTNNVSDRKKSFLSFLVGILAVCKALILKRANAALLARVEEIAKRKHSIEDEQKTIELQQQQIRNYRKMEDNFAESQAFFKNSPSPSTVCPKAWSSRASSIPKFLGTRISPSEDLYFLPLGPYSDFGEACAFLYGCLQEFVDVFGIELNSGTRYTLQAGRDTGSNHD